MNPLVIISPLIIILALTISPVIAENTGDSLMLKVFDRLTGVDTNPTIMITVGVIIGIWSILRLKIILQPIIMGLLTHKKPEQKDDLMMREILKIMDERMDKIERELNDLRNHFINRLK